MLRIFSMALAVAFLGSITPAIAQGTGGSPGKQIKTKSTLNTMVRPKVKAKTKTKGHKGGKKGKKGKKSGANPPSTTPK